MITIWIVLLALLWAIPLVFEQRSIEMIRQAFRKIIAFMGLTAAVASIEGHPQGVRIKRDTSAPRSVRRRQVPHGRMRVFRSF